MLAKHDLIAPDAQPVVARPSVPIRPLASVFPEAQQVCAQGHTVADLQTILLCQILSSPEAHAAHIAQASALLAAFGDLRRVIQQDPCLLVQAAGLSDSQIRMLKGFEAAVREMLRSTIADRPLLSNWAALLDYCHFSLSHRDREQFRVLFLDTKNHLIADEVMGEGTVNHVPVYPREVLRRALQLNATALILLHNHPSGDPSPSSADIEMTRLIQRASEPLGIVVHDHVIIGAQAHVSLRAEGYM